MTGLLDSLEARWQAMDELGANASGPPGRPRAPSDSLQTKIDTLRQTVDQWNPHHPTKAEAIEKWTALLDSRQELLDDLRRHPNADAEEMLSIQLDQADGFLNGPMHRARGAAQARARAASMTQELSGESATEDIRLG